MLIHFCIVYGCFPATTVELSSCKRPYGPQSLKYLWSGPSLQKDLWPSLLAKMKYNVLQTCLLPRRAVWDLAKSLESNRFKCQLCQLLAMGTCASYSTFPSLSFLIWEMKMLTVLKSGVVRIKLFSVGKALTTEPGIRQIHMQFRVRLRVSVIF